MKFTKFMAKYENGTGYAGGFGDLILDLIEHRQTLQWRRDQDFDHVLLRLCQMLNMVQVEIPYGNIGNTAIAKDIKRKC